MLASTAIAIVSTAAMVSGPAEGDLAWRSCPDGAGAECARLTVPLDRTDLDGPTVSLPLRRLRAADPERRIGTLVTIAGGPGQRGTEHVVPGMHTPTIEGRFDIVSFDPRGTSGETDITCIPVWDAYAGVDRTPDDVAERRMLARRTTELVADCQAAHPELLAHVGTADTVLDVEVLRVALGEPRISLFGSSYGSEVALRYATAFPERTQGVVLDGYSDPNLPRLERDLEQAAAFEHQLDELLTECALRDDCAIGGADTPGAALDRLLADLDRSPIPAGEGASLRQGDAYEAITGALVGGRGDREALLHALAAAASGDGGPLLGMAERIRGLYRDSGLDLGSFTAIACADSRHQREHTSNGEATDLEQRAADLAPRLGPWLWGTADDGQGPLGLCAMTPPEVVVADGPFDAAGAGPVLVLAATGDPATPLSAAQRSLDDLEDAALMVVRADQHLVYPYAVARPRTAAHACVLMAVESYLLDGVVPSSSTCP